MSLIGLFFNTSCQILKYMKNLKILYAKGGHAIEEAERLFKREGEIEKTGPD